MLRLLRVLLLGLALFRCSCFRQGSPIGQPGIQVPMELKKPLVVQSSSFYLLRDSRYALPYLVVLGSHPGLRAGRKALTELQLCPFS